MKIYFRVKTEQTHSHWHLHARAGKVASIGAICQKRNRLRDLHGSQTTITNKNAIRNYKNANNNNKVSAFLRLFSC